MIFTNSIVTAYCACQICCGPNAANITAKGTVPVQGRTIAAPRNIPLGTVVKIQGKTYTVEDRTARKYDGRFDIFFSSHKEALKFGKRTNNVEVIK